MNASWVAIDLMEFAVRTEDAVQSPEAALEWLRSFRDTLLMEGRNSRPMPWAVELLGMADVKIAKKSIARMQGQIVKINGKDCDVDLECSKKYGEKYEKLKNILAAAATREGADVLPTRESGHCSHTTGCDNSQEAPTRKAGDESSDAGNGAALKSGTSCNPLTADGDTREDSLNVTDGSNAALLESGASANLYGPRQAEDRRSQPCAGEVPPENVSAPSPALPLPAKAAYGEFGNIKMTNIQYAKLCERFGFADTVIEEADQYFEAQPSKKKKYKNHYAMLLNWCKRRETEAKPKQGYMTSDDISRKNYEESKARLEAMFSKGRATA